MLNAAKESIVASETELNTRNPASELEGLQTRLDQSKEMTRDLLTKVELQNPTENPTSGLWPLRKSRRNSAAYPLLNVAFSLRKGVSCIRL